MSIYVDNMRAPFGRMIMCHMLGDSDKELLAMADKIGVAQKWIQHPGTYKTHFDIALSKRAKAIEYGAQEITMKQMSAMVTKRMRIRRVEILLS